MAGVSADIILRLLAEDNASSTIDNVKGNVDGITSSARSGGNAIGELSRGISMVDSALTNAIAFASSRNIYELTIGNASSAETGKVLLKNILDDAETNYESVYKHLDELTNTSLISLNEMMPAMANFKAATGIADSQIEHASNTMANFGQYVLASTGSTARAEKAMNDLSKGLKGSFASLDQYKLTEDALINTGFWDGEATNVEGYLKAVDAVIGDTRELMQTNEGVDALLSKTFSREGKAIGNELLPYLKEAKIAFIEWNEAADGFPAKVLIGADMALSGIVSTMSSINTTLAGVQQLKQAWSDISGVLSKVKDKMNGVANTTVPSTGGSTGSSVDLPDGDSKTKGGGGVAGDIEKTGEVAGDVEEAGETFNKADHVNKLKNIIMKFVKAAVIIAGIFLLIAEVLVGVWLEMAIISEIGKTYRANKGNIESGIQGMIAIAPILILLGSGVALLVVALDKLNVSTSSIVNGGITAAVGIAVVFALISEVLLLMIAPILALAATGSVYQGLSSQVQAGIQGVQTVSNVLIMLAPFLPLFAVAVLLVASGVGAVLGAIVGGAAIILMMAMLSAFILSMVAPLLSIAALGTVASQIQGVDTGIQAIRQVASALKAVESAASSMVGITFDNLKSWIASGFKSSKDQLMELVAPGGIITGIKEFIQKFNTVSTGMAQFNPSNVQNLSQSINAMKLIINAIRTIQFSLVNMNGLGGGILNAVGGAITNALLTPMLNQIKSTAQSLASFNTSISNLNVQQLDTTKIQALVQTGQAIVRIKSTIDSVKNAVASINQASGSANANNGIGGMVAGAIGGNNSLKPALQQLLSAVDDITWFNQQLASKTGTSQNNGSNMQGTASAVVQISNTIKQISAILTSSIPKMRNGGVNIGKNISQGIKIGISTLSLILTQLMNTILTRLVTLSRTKGQQAGNSLKTSYSNSIKGLKTITQTEINYTLQTLNAAIPRFSSAGAALGRALSDSYQREGLQQQSPGRIARTTSQEIIYTLNSISKGQNLLYNAGVKLGQALSTGFKNPELKINDTITDINTDIKDIQSLDNLGKIETIQDTGGNYINTNGNTKTTIINVSAGAVPIDARNMTQKESQQIMIQAFESLQNIGNVRTA